MINYVRKIFYFHRLETEIIAYTVSLSKRLLIQGYLNQEKKRRDKIEIINVFNFLFSCQKKILVSGKI